MFSRPQPKKKDAVKPVSAGLTTVTDLLSAAPSTATSKKRVRDGADGTEASIPEITESIARKVVKIGETDDVSDHLTGAPTSSSAPRVPRGRGATHFQNYADIGYQHKPNNSDERKAVRRRSVGGQHRQVYLESSSDEAHGLDHVAGGIVEKTEVYQIKASNPVQPFPLDHEDLQFFDVNNPARMLEAGYADKDDITELFGQKNRMDALFDDNRGKLYYEVRDRQFPQDKRGSTKFSNRAGDKLWQVHEAINLFDPVPSDSSFIDVCGGPGAFSLLLLDKFKFKRGFGLTLRVPMTNTNEYWYANLEKRDDFTITWGADDQGDVYVPQNLDFVTDQLKEDQISVVVSDGGFKIQKIGDKHMENYQELFSGRIILSEFVMMMKCIAVGGHFVTKLFDCFSALTISLIYVATLLFEEVYIVKPVRSRIVNSERYLAAKRLKQKDGNFEFLRTVLETAHQRLHDAHVSDRTINSTPLTVIPREMIHEDADFMVSVIEMVTELCNKQTSALKQVMDEVDAIVQGSR